MESYKSASCFVQQIWHEYLEHRNYGLFGEVVDESISVIGTGAHEVSCSLEEFAAKMQKEADFWDGSFRILEEWNREQELGGGLFVVYGEIKAEEDAHDRIIYDFHFRYTVVLKQEEYNYRILHVHQSMPDATQNSDEFFPKHLVDQSNQQLQKKIEEKTRELEKSHQAVIYYSQHDYLTKLMNRYYGEKLIHASMEREGLGTLVIMDIDEFKFFNDQYGHLVGDQILIVLAKSLLQAFADAICVRMGGDEFLVYSSTMQSRKACEQQLCVFQTLWKEQQNALQLKETIEVSVGVARYPADGASLNEMLNKADQSMYLQKRSRKKEVQEKGH